MIFAEIRKATASKYVYKFAYRFEFFSFLFLRILSAIVTIAVVQVELLTIIFSCFLPLNLSTAKMTSVLMWALGLRQGCVLSPLLFII